MTESAGARIALGTGIIVALVGLAVILEQASGSDRAEPSGVASTAVPTELQFCVAWQRLASMSEVDRSSPKEATTRDLREAIAEVRELGMPSTMTSDARAGLAAALDGIEAGVDPDFQPTAIPAAPAEDTAFSGYLQEHCPA